MDAHAQIRALNLELAKKTKLIDDLKSKVQHFTSKRNARDLGQDEDVVEYLVTIVKEKEKVIEELQLKVTQLVRREQDLKDRVEKYEFIYDVPPDQKASQNRFFEKADPAETAKSGGSARPGTTPSQGIEQMLNKFKAGKTGVRPGALKQEVEKSEWLYF